MMVAVLALCAFFIINACDTTESVKPYQGQVFIKLFGGNGSEEGKDLLQLDDGGFIMVGYSTSKSIPEIKVDPLNTDINKDVYIVRTDNLGNVMWERRSGKSGDDVGSSVILGSDGDLYVCGENEYMKNDTTFTGINDVYVLKISLKDGSYIADNSYGDTLREERGTSILDIENGGFLITSTWITEDKDTSTFFMVETDDNLVALAKKEDYVGTKGVDNLSTTSFEVINSTPFVCFGSVKEFNTKKYHFQSFMYQPSKNKAISSIRYGSGQYDEWCTGAYQTTDGGFILAGYQDDGMYKKEMVVKIDANRNEIWKEVYTNVFNKSIGESCGIIQTQDGGYLVSSKIELDDPENDEISLLKLNAIGDLEWRQTFGSNDNDVGARVIQLEDGSYVVVGTIGFSINQSSETKMCLIKVNANGELVPIN